jgi:hypothetical protein
VGADDHPLGGGRCRFVRGFREARDDVYEFYRPVGSFIREGLEFDLPSKFSTR